jgi:hypothetical protein
MRKAACQLPPAASQQNKNGNSLTKKTNSKTIIWTLMEEIK